MPSRYAPSYRQVRYVRARLSGKAPRAAAEEAGYAYNKGTLHKLEHNPRMAEWMAEAMAGRGITAETLVAKLQEGLDSSVVERLMHQKSGAVQEFASPDMHARHKFLDVALRLMGAYPKAPAARVEETGQGIDLVRFVQNHEPLPDEAFLEAVQRARLRMGGASR